MSRLEQPRNRQETAKRPVAMRVNPARGTPRLEGLESSWLVRNANWAVEGNEMDECKERKSGTK